MGCQDHTVENGCGTHQRSILILSYLCCRYLQETYLAINTSPHKPRLIFCFIIVHLRYVPVDPWQVGEIFSIFRKLGIGWSYYLPFILWSWSRTTWPSTGFNASEISISSCMILFFQVGRKRFCDHACVGLHCGYHLFHRHHLQLPHIVCQQHWRGYHKWAKNTEVKGKSPI